MGRAFEPSHGFAPRHAGQRSGVGGRCPRTGDGALRLPAQRVHACLPRRPETAWPTSPSPAAPVLVPGQTSCPPLGPQSDCGHKRMFWNASGGCVYGSGRSGSNGNVSYDVLRRRQPEHGALDTSSLKHEHARTRHGARGGPDAINARLAAPTRTCESEPGRM